MDGGRSSPPHQLFIPVILGTPRQGRMSARVARFVASEIGRKPGVTTGVIDVAAVPLTLDDAGEAIKDPSFAESMNRADALVIVSPEYNHSFPGLLKHLLDTCLEEYIHKAVGIAGVSAGTFGGARGIQNLLPVLRELGLVTIFWDLNFGNVNNVFTDTGELVDKAFIARADKFLKELIWMAETLRYGRTHIPQRS